MKSVAALSGFILCVCLESQGLRLPFGYAGIPEELPQFLPGPLFPMQERMPGNPQNEYVVLHEGYGGYGGYGEYLPYGAVPEPRPRPEPTPRSRKCMDKNAASFCKNALMDNKCVTKTYQTRCTKSCGMCKDEGECEDTSFKCKRARYQPGFYCSLSWFATGCKKTCKLCPPTISKIASTVSTTTTTTMPEASTVSTTTTTTMPEETTAEEITAGAKENPQAREATMMEPASEEISKVETVEQEDTTEDSGIEPLCVDTDHKNCQTWERIGLCYNPVYEEDMAQLCRLSCQLCQP